MQKFKSRNSTVIDEAPAMTDAETKLATSLEDKNSEPQVQPGLPALHNSATPDSSIAAEQMTKYLHGVAAESIDEIDALMRDLRGLQENLAANSVRVNQEIMQFLELNQSVLALTDVISGSVAQVKSN